MSKTPVWKHFAAFIYDVFPVVGIFILTSLVVLVARNGVEVQRFSPWFTTLLLSEFSLYYIYSWKIGGQTLGMRAWKIKIIPNNSNQSQITWGQAALRFLIGILSTVFLGLGVYWKAISRQKKSWMDLVSHSETRNL